MKYMLLIYGPADGDWSAEGAEEEMKRYWDYEKAVAEAGVMVSSEALQGVDTATTITVTDAGERIVTDGPFAETREVLGGYYVLDVPDLDAALDWAARCPGSQRGQRIEVRPLHVFDTP